MNRLPPVVLGLVIANAVVFLAGVVSPGAREWIIEKGAFWFHTNENSAVWQAFTYMFLHGSPGHILFNMFALASFGGILERQWGMGRFLLFYFLCGIGAALVHSGVDQYNYHALENRLVAQGLTPSTIASLLTGAGGDLPIDEGIKRDLTALYRIYAAPMLGASGAIYGVLVAFGLLYPNAKLALFFIPVPIAAKIVIPALLALDLLSGVTGFSLFGGGIAHFAHLGGALIGFLLTLFWRKRSDPPPTQTMR